VEVDLLETHDENRHPWELSRTDCILNLLKSKITKGHAVIADVGCGDLYFSKRLANEFDCTIFSIDTGFTDLHSGHNKITKLKSIDVLDNGSIDIAVLMDVLEHLENPNMFLRNLSRKMSQKGAMLFTVPAFQHLFSKHDTFLKHYRRYSRRALSIELSNAGLTVENVFYFYSILYPLRLVQVMTSKVKNENDIINNIAAWKHDENSNLTKSIRQLLNIDFNINKLLRILPFGLSVCAICSRP